MPVTADKPAPYAPASGLIDMMTRFRDRGLPTPVNAEVLQRAGITDSLNPRVLYALQCLDLIDENGMPTPVFEGLRRAPQDEYKKRMADWLKAAYADVFSFVDPATDGEVRIRDAFRNYNPPGQQSRMVSLFTGLCMAAGLMSEKPATAAAPHMHRAPATLRGVVRVNANARVLPKPKTFAGGGTQINMPPAISGLLATLPDPNVGWTVDERDKFVKAFTAMLEYSFPIKAEATEIENGG